MAFEKGKGKTGGRAKGIKNKKHLLLESFAKSVIEGGMEKFQSELNKLSGIKYVHAYLALYEYVSPKLRRVDGNLNANISFLEEETVFD
jgi:hypothetical protein